MLDGIYFCPTNSQTHCVVELTDQPVLRGKLNTGSGNVAMSSLRMLYALLLSHQKRIPETYTENTNKQRGRTRERRATQRKRERTRVIEGEVLGSKPEAALCIAGALNHFKGKQQYGSHIFSFHNWLLGLVVGFSLRVREVPSSIPGGALCICRCAQPLKE